MSEEIILIILGLTSLWFRHRLSSFGVYFFNQPHYFEGIFGISEVTGEFELIH